MRKLLCPFLLDSTKDYSSTLPKYESRYLFCDMDPPLLLDGDSNSGICAAVHPPQDVHFVHHLPPLWSESRHPYHQKCCHRAKNLLKTMRGARLCFDRCWDPVEDEDEQVAPMTDVTIEWRAIQRISTAHGKIGNRYSGPSTKNELGRGRSLAHYL